MSEGFAEPPDDAWTELTRDEYDGYWATFKKLYGFRAGVSPEAWPAITEPAPSLTFDLSVIPDGARRGAAYDAVNAEALRAFVWGLPDAELIVLDWQHPAYRFRPANHALAWRPEWQVPVYPDGDYFAFLTEDLQEGTFGHPWEQTLCVMGERLGATLGRSLATWLPVKRLDGMSTREFSQPDRTHLPRTGNANVSVSGAHLRASRHGAAVDLTRNAQRHLGLEPRMTRRSYPRSCGIGRTLRLRPSTANGSVSFRPPSPWAWGLGGLASCSQMGT